jgi:hypothetical protein
MRRKTAEHSGFAPARNPESDLRHKLHCAIAQGAALATVRA